MAWKSLRRTPVVSALMIGAIALGIGVCTTSLTVFHLMSRNPIEARNDVLYAVTLDNWDPNNAWDDKHPDLPPFELTYRDATALLESPIPDRHVAMYKSGFVVEAPNDRSIKPYSVIARMTTHDFFAMFAAPFQYGSGWSAGADDSAQLNVVLSKATNDKLFGGADSVGRTLRLDGREYLVAGVLKEWTPTPRFYDLNNGALTDLEDVFVPLSIGAQLELGSRGNINCWRQETLNSYKDFLGSDCVWIQFWAELRTPEKVAAFQSFIDNYVREQKKLGRFERPLNNHLRKPDEWLRVNRVVDDDNRVLVGLSFMFLMVCLLNMIGLLLAKFLGAASLAGLRRALGASRKMVFRDHIVEVGLVGFIGGVFGLGLSALGLTGVRQLYGGNFDQLTHLDLPMVAVALGVAVFAGVIAGLYPAWRVCRVQPAVHLKTQ